MRPGTKPRTEYEYGNDIIAKQMYSLNRSAAVYIGPEMSEIGHFGVCTPFIYSSQPISCMPHVLNPFGPTKRKGRRKYWNHLLPRASPVLDGIARFQLKLLLHAHLRVGIRVRQDHAGQRWRNPVHIAAIVALLLGIVGGQRTVGVHFSGHSVVCVDHSGLLFSKKS